MQRLKRQVYRAEQGQSLVEFALSLIILLTILMGIFDLGRMFFSQIALQDAVGEGAQYASINPQCYNSSACADPNNITFRTRNASPSGFTNLGNIAVTVDYGPYTPSTLVIGVPITVSAAYTYPLATFVIGSIVGRNYLLLTAQSQGTVQSP